jgi:hypothetical protein
MQKNRYNIGIINIIYKKENVNELPHTEHLCIIWLANLRLMHITVINCIFHSNNIFEPLLIFR